MGVYLSFEKPIESLQLKIEDLKRLSDGEDIDIASEIAKLQKKADSLRDNIFSNLSSWETTQVARHPDRPYTMDYISLIVDDFIEMHGDRCYADDPAIVGGFGRIDQTSLMIIGHQKGRGVKERITRNFGQPQPEGYRKALRLMKTAERFGLPVLTFIDTPGAYPGIGAEERGQAEAIATNLLEMSRLKVPLVAVVIGEGGSGGALALSVTDRLYMLSYSIYSVISPEGCASILWAKDGDLNAEDYSKAADALKLTAQDLKGFEVIDEVIQEPPGGAHRDSAGMAASIKETVLQAFSELGEATGEKLIESRYNRLRQIGRYIEPQLNEESSPQ